MATKKPVTKKASSVTKTDPKLAQQTKVVTKDAFMNVLARMGLGTPNLLEGTEYPLTRLTKNFQLMNSLYRSHWIVRRVIDVIPEDMCKNWYSISSQLEPEQLDKFNKINRKIKAQVLEGLKWGRLYGGAVGLMLIKGHGDKLEEPLELDEIYPDDFKGLKIYDRWSGVYPQMELVEDIGEDEFGLPEFYQVTDQNSTYKIHHSRLVRFIGRDLPYLEKVAETYWGASEVEHIYDELKKRDNTSWNIAQLVFLANLRVLKMADMGEMLATGSDAVQKQMYDTVQAQNWLMSNMGMYILGKDDGFETHQYSFSGLSEIYQNFMTDIAGAAEIPATKLFGKSPDGMNASGDGDLQNYYETIEQKQEAYLRPVIDKLLPVICMSLFGAIPDDLDYRFNPIARPNPKETSDIASSRTTTIIDTYNANLISQQTAMKELRQLEDTSGMWSNITDEDIEKADTEISTQTEMMAMPDMNFGGGKVDGQEEEDGPGRMEADKTSGAAVREDTK